MPPESLLEEVRFDNEFDDHGWGQLLRCLMFLGVKQTAKLLPREVDGARLDGETAWRHLQALAASFQPKHEHKEAAFAILCKEFWEWGIWEDSSGKVYEAGLEKLSEEDKRELGF